RGGWVHLNLPTEFDPSRRCRTVVGWEDPRTERGELLFPAKFPRSVVDEAKVTLGEYGYAAQHDQNPRPPGGGIFKEWHLRFWWPRGVDAPPPHRVRLPDGSWHSCAQKEMPHDREASLWIQSWDMAFKAQSANSFV